MDIVENIENTLARLFPDIKQIRSDDMEQGINDHSLFLKDLSSSQQSQLFGVQNREYSFVLHYFPKKFPKGQMSFAETECRKMRDRLYGSFINLDQQGGKVLRASAEIISGVLLFKFRVKARYIFKDEPATPMETINERGTLKNG